MGSDCARGCRQIAEDTARLAVTLTCWVAAVVGVTLLLLERAARAGQISINAALASFGAACLATWTAAIWLFLRRGIPPIEEQTDRLTDALHAVMETNARQHDFLAHLHHELRTPLTKLLGATETLHHRGDQLADRERDQVRAIAHDGALQVSMVLESLSVSVDAALPGYRAGVPTDNWSSALHAVRPVGSAAATRTTRN